MSRLVVPTPSGPIPGGTKVTARPRPTALLRPIVTVHLPVDVGVAMAIIAAVVDGHPDAKLDATGESFIITAWEHVDSDDPRLITERTPI